MPDTHDERGGDVAARVGRIADRIGGALDELRGLHGANRAKRGIAGAVADLRDIADEVRQQLAAATARAEKAEALVAELGEPETEQRIIGVSGRVYTPTEFDVPHRADWVPGVRLEERQVYPTPWRVVYPVCRSCGETERVLGDPPLCSNCAVYAPASFTGLLAAPRLASDAAQDGLSATETDVDGVQAYREGSNSSAIAAGLSEPEGGCPWCGTLQKLDADGLIGEHRRFNGTKCPGATRRPNDDMTEDGQHG